MEALSSFILFLDSFLGSAFYFPWLLIGVGVFFTIYLGFPQIRYFGQATRILRGQYTKADAPGDTSHFQALTTALSGTVGTGNIGGVALAIYFGGPAALFWMWVTAFFGMTTKFVEVTLSHKYREKTADGTMAGGPMYYMEKKLNMKWLAVIFAIATVISSMGSGNMPQINNIAVGMNESFGIEKWITGGVLAVILALVIIGGIKRIAHFAEKVVPTMAAIYLIGAMAVIFANLENIGPSFAAIFEQAFTGSAAMGGFLGATFWYAMMRGVNRGLFSNEAGQGSAAIAHASAKGNEPASEGMVSLLEPFIDTIIICTITGLVILSSGVWSEKHQNTIDRADMTYVQGTYVDSNEEDVKNLFLHLNGEDGSNVEIFEGEIPVQNGVAVANNFTLIAARSIAEDVTYSVEGEPFTGTLEISAGKIQNEGVIVDGKSLIHSIKLTSEAFKRGFFGDWGQYIVTIGLLLFAFSTAIAWSYYGDRAMIYLLGEGAVLPYRVVYVGAFFLAAIIDSAIIWDVALVTVALMTIPNLIGIFLLHKDMRETVDSYWEHFRKNQAD
ncbi:sodium:alanine symporter family protein [Aliikangiella marina]|uniref:Sodium:alanine symporter family protein n=1 Tax=Aliikangiella marina TaxID=1712262 RepID=A0A545TIE5_9GAMM|nr:sodium:alanine symporter family protein [Aliikangiella marina]TQV76988.1 sodium:alanine symporter family protein [Aliikangiella marina]